MTTTAGVHRKLAAILCADVEGYSRLIADDPEATIETLSRYRTIFAECSQCLDGRVVDSPGDNLLIEFASIADAVQCAVEIQHELAAKNAELSEQRRMRFRIGIDLGDVLEKDGALYGEGVNISSRLQALIEGTAGACPVRTVRHGKCVVIRCVV
jgi:class 3 adenylate cyclase